MKVVSKAVVREVTELENNHKYRKAQVEVLLNLFHKGMLDIL